MSRRTQTFEDHSIRALMYLIITFPIVAFALTALGSLALGTPGIIMGAGIAVALTLWGYSAYLKLWKP